MCVCVCLFVFVCLFVCLFAHVFVYIYIYIIYICYVIQIHAMFAYLNYIFKIQFVFVSRIFWVGFHYRSVISDRNASVVGHFPYVEC